MTDNNIHDEAAHGCGGSCGGIENLEWIDEKIERRSLPTSECEEEAREMANREVAFEEVAPDEMVERRKEDALEWEEDDGTLGRRSFMGKAAGAAAAGAAGVATLSGTAAAHGDKQPIFTPDRLNVRKGPGTNYGIKRTTARGVGFWIYSGPYHSSSDNYRWWKVRVNRDKYNYRRTGGYVVERYTAHPNFTYPCYGRVTSTYYDWRDNRTRRHRGCDLADDWGTDIVASRGGKVTAAGKAGGYGKMVDIYHGNGFKTRYAHLSDSDTYRGDRVSRWEKIGDMGNTGDSSGTHLHFEIRRNGYKQNWPMHKYSYKWRLTGVAKQWF